MSNFNGFIAAISLAMLSGSASADIINCEYSVWTGAKDEDVAISWLGVGSKIDTKRGVVSIEYQNGNSRDLKIDQINSAEKFTTYVAYHADSSTTGEKLVKRYSFRVYHNKNKGEARMSADGYVDLTAKGICK